MTFFILTISQSSNWVALAMNVCLMASSNRVWLADHRGRRKCAYYLSLEVYAVETSSQFLYLKIGAISEGLGIFVLSPQVVLCRLANGEPRMAF